MRTDVEGLGEWRPLEAQPLRGWDDNVRENTSPKGRPAESWRKQEEVGKDVKLFIQLETWRKHGQQPRNILRQQRHRDVVCKNNKSEGTVFVSLVTKSWGLNRNRSAWFLKILQKPCIQMFRFGATNKSQNKTPALLPALTLIHADTQRWSTAYNYHSNFQMLYCLVLLHFYSFIYYHHYYYYFFYKQTFWRIWSGKFPLRHSSG